MAASVRFRFEKNAKLTFFTKGVILRYVLKYDLTLLVQCNISIPSENVRKPLVFGRFQGV